MQILYGKHHKASKLNAEQISKLRDQWKEQPNNAKPKYKCEMCNRRFFDREYFQYHLESFHGK